MTRISFCARTFLAAAASFGTLAAQEKPVPLRYFPFTPMRVEAGDVLLEPELLPMQELCALRAVRLGGVVDSLGRVVTLDLERADLQFEPGAVHVDGVAQAQSTPAGTSLWTGRIAGVPGSRAFLAISPYGTRGWFGTPREMHHLLAQPAGNDWSRARLRVLSQSMLDAHGEPPLWSCESPSLEHVAPRDVRRDPFAEGGGPTPIYAAPIVFETTYEYYTVFNDLGAAQAYTTALLGAISNLYREQVGVVFTIPYLGFHTVNDDPWSPDTCINMNLAFRAAWSGNRAPARGVLYHLITSSACGGGVAYLGALCNRDIGFGVSGSVIGQTPFPPAQGPLSWDFVVIAHEVGHGFGAIHTHEYQPPIDSCGLGNCTSPAGTLMSYCHSCPGGMSNIALEFHPQSAADMRATVLASCLRTLTAANDECAAPLRVVDGANGPFHNGAASDSQPAWPCGGTASRDLWFVYTAYCTGDLTLETCGLGTDFDTKIEIFSGSCGAVTSLACSDDACGAQGWFSRIVTPVKQDAVYLVRVGGFEGATGNFGLSVACSGVREHHYDIAWKYALTPDRTSGLLAMKGTDTGTCRIDAAGTFEAEPIDDGTFTRDARGKLVADVGLADLQRIVDAIYGTGILQLESVLLAKTKLQQTFGKNGLPGKVKFSLSAQATFGGGKILKLKVSFSGLQT